MKRFLLLPVLLLSIGCASLPVKQKATTYLQTAEQLLAQAHDAERQLCSPSADKTKAILHCDGELAVQVGLTDARHHDLALIFAKAFVAQEKTALALRGWKAGEPFPNTLIELQADLSQAREVVDQLTKDKRVQTILDTLKAATDAVIFFVATSGRN